MNRKESNFQQEIFKRKLILERQKFQKGVVMIDFQVAYDKLAQFEFADDIAEYMKDCNIKAVREEPAECAVSEWMYQQTGFFVRTGVTGMLVLDDQERLVFRTRLTPALITFVSDFDDNKYPELVKEEIL